MKKRLPTILITLLFMIGLLITSYPLISNWYYESNQIHTIEEYTKLVANKSDQELEKEIKKADEYNEALRGYVEITDPFTPNTQIEADTKYESLLNIDQTGIMGYIQIPSIDVYLPIYHGTEESVLKLGAGHLLNTSLPVGGKSTHTVITGHTGLSSSKLFTELSEVEEGELFYIHILNQTIAYQVNQIKVVEPSNITDLLIEDGKDYATLVTCTPYGINSHRLLVRGIRVEYEKGIEEAMSKPSVHTNNVWLMEYFNILIPAAAFMGIVLSMVVLKNKIRSRR